MNANIKKGLKIITLLITAAVIATASAGTYYTMFMTGSVGIAGNEVIFTQGTDWSAGSSMGGGSQTVTLSLAGSKGAITTISDPVNIKNNGAGDHSVNLQLNSWDGESETDLNYIHVTIYNAASGGTAQAATIQLVPGGADVTQTGSVTIPADGVYRVEWVIYWKDTATTETVTVNLKLDVT